jgi:REP-associated tyrosine transposase
MPRQPRVYEPGLSLHVIQRGNNRGGVFAENTDYCRLLALMRKASCRDGVDVHAFVLMTTHFHLLVTPQHEWSLARFMQCIDGEYAQYFNRRHGRIGTLWNERYRGIHIRDEQYWLTCLRYIEQNPVRAKIVLKPEVYPWSSYRFHAGGDSCSWLKSHDCYLRLGPNPAARQAAYRAICGIPLTESELKLQRDPPRRTDGNPWV